MLKPQKYTDLQTSILSVAGEAVKISSSISTIKYDELLKRILTRKGPGAKENFLPAIDLLFLLGKIEYSKKEDIFEFKK